MTNDGMHTLAFDGESRLTQASGTSGGPWSYVYDGNGLSVERNALRFALPFG